MFLALLPLLAGCNKQSQMTDQPRYDPLESSKLFRDGTSAREPPKGTVPRGDARLDRAFYSGVDAAGGFVTSPPVRASRELLLRGQARYAAYCTPCHGLVGDGSGMIVLRGYKRPPSFHIDRLRSQPAGYYVDVITNGFGTMPAYADKVSPADRWAITAYIGALQLSQGASAAELPPDDGAKLEVIQ